MKNKQPKKIHPKDMMMLLDKAYWCVMLRNGTKEISEPSRNLPISLHKTALTRLVKAGLIENTINNPRIFKAYHLSDTGVAMVKMFAVMYSPQEILYQISLMDAELGKG